MNPHDALNMRIADEIEEACEQTYIELPRAIEIHFRDFSNNVLATARALADVSHLLVETDEILTECDVEKAVSEWLQERAGKKTWSQEPPAS